MTGNYGNTAALLVTVPEKNPPPPPWSIRTSGNTATDKFKLNWDLVNVANYHEDHKSKRTYCNLDTAKFDRKLSFVSGENSCDNTNPIVVDLNVTDYLVYRFITIDEASKFSDIDGDGFSDTDERGAANTPGTSCDASSTPGGGGATNYQIAVLPSASAQIRPSGRAVIEFDDLSIDEVRGVTKDNVFWYRIASRDSDGNVSDLSAPVRGFFPERKKPLRGELGNGTFGVQACNYDANIIGIAGTVVGNYVLPFATDTTADASHLRVSCQLFSGDKLSWNYPFSTQTSGQSGVKLSSGQCQAIEQQCVFGVDNTTLPFTMGYHSQSGTLLASVDQPTGGWNCTYLPASALTKTCNTIQGIEDGEVVSGPIVYEPPPNFRDCIKFYRDINGKTYHHKTFCPPAGTDLTGPIVLDIPSMGGELTCMSAAIQNQNGEVSTKFRFPCFVFDLSIALSAPSPLDIQFTPNSDTATLSWLPPEQSVVGSFVEWYWKGADAGVTQSSFSRFFPHAGHSAADGSVTVDVQITVEQSGSDWQEEWCFRSRSVGQSADPGNEALSEWSPEVCNQRLALGQTPPNYLAWPDVEAPKFQAVDTADGLLPARYLANDELPVVLLSKNVVEMPGSCDLLNHNGDQYVSGIGNCDAQSNATACFPSIGSNTPNSSITCGAALCNSVDASVTGKLNFVAYRQSATDTNTSTTFSDYIQVSPLIERAFCKTAVTFIDMLSGTTIRTTTLNDPFIKLAELNSAGPDWNGMRAMFVDSYPHILNTWYRYQFVRFDSKGEITGYQQTDWVQAQ